MAQQRVRAVRPFFDRPREQWILNQTPNRRNQQTQSAQRAVMYESEASADVAKIHGEDEETTKLYMVIPNTCTPRPALLGRHRMANESATEAVAKP